MDKTTIELPLPTSGGLEAMYQFHKRARRMAEDRLGCYAVCEGVAVENGTARVTYSARHHMPTFQAVLDRAG